jgi:hypothetical protein
VVRTLSTCPASCQLVQSQVQLMGQGSPPAVQRNAAKMLWGLARGGEVSISVSIAAAGPIPDLVRLMGPGGSAKVKQAASGLLAFLMRHEENVASSVAAFVELLGSGSGSPAGVALQLVAAQCLMSLAKHPENAVTKWKNAVTIVEAGAIPPLMQMRLGPDPELSNAASSALEGLGDGRAAHRAAITAEQRSLLANHCYYR